MTVAGNCTAGSVEVTGCLSSNSLTGYTTVTGNIIGTATNMGASGKINWSPADTTPPSNYIKIWTGGTDFYYMTANPEPAVADVKSGVTYGWDGSAVYTGTLATGGGVHQHGKKTLTHTFSSLYALCIIGGNILLCLFVRL
jgi:hypothetical protein